MPTDTFHVAGSVMLPHDRVRETAGTTEVAPTEKESIPSRPQSPAASGFTIPRESDSRGAVCLSCLCVGMSLTNQRGSRLKPQRCAQLLLFEKRIDRELREAVELALQPSAILLPLGSIPKFDVVADPQQHDRAA